MGTFLKRVRKGKVASPTTPKWSLADWQRAFDGSNPHDESDQTLFSAGKWFALMLEAHRVRAIDLSTLGLQRNELARAAVAGINRNWVIAEQQLRISSKPDGVVVSEELMSRRIKLKHWDIEVDPNGLMEAAVDSVRHIVSTSAASTTKRASVGEILDALFYRSILSSGYLTLEALWKNCLWNSWAVVEAPDVDMVRPTELRQAAAEAAATFREQTLQFSHTIDVHRSWKDLSLPVRAQLANYRVVKEIRGSGREIQILIRQHRLDETPGAYGLHVMGVDAWLDHLIDKELPNLAPLTLRLLIRGWDFLRTLASASQRRMPEDTSVFDLPKLWSYAPAYEAGTLVKRLACALDVSHPTAVALHGILATESIKDADLWLTPLWKLDERYLLMLPVALTSNPKRLIDHWLALGGVDLGIRGSLFETYVRELCIKGIARSSILNDRVHCAAGGIELDPSIGDMDLVCLIGNTILVGEIKCTTTPSSSVERANYLGILNDAAEQVLTKVAHAQANIAALANATGWQLTTPTFITVIITNQEIGVGQRIDGVPVVDHAILEKYFRSPVLEHGVTFAADGHKTVMSETRFYRTPGEAERNLESYLMSPPQLRTALRWLRTTESPLLTIPGAKPVIQRDFVVSAPPMSLGAHPAAEPASL